MSKDVKPQEFKTYISAVANSVESSMWRNGYAEVDGDETDIMENGVFSCAYFVSSILKVFDKVDKFHATVSATITDMEKSGWHKVETPQEGDVLYWGKREDGDNEHVGFYVGDNKAVSNNYVSSKHHEGGRPQFHHWLYEGHPDGERPLIAIYRGRHLFKS